MCKRREGKGLPHHAYINSYSTPAPSVERLIHVSTVECRITKEFCNLRLLFCNTPRGFMLLLEHAFLALCSTGILSRDKTVPTLGVSCTASFGIQKAVVLLVVTASMPLIYAFVSRGTTVLADYTSYTGERMSCLSLVSVLSGAYGEHQSSVVTFLPLRERKNLFRSSYSYTLQATLQLWRFSAWTSSIRLLPTPKSYSIAIIIHSTTLWTGDTVSRSISQCKATSASSR